MSDRRDSALQLVRLDCDVLRGCDALATSDASALQERLSAWAHVR